MRESREAERKGRVPQVSTVPFGAGVVPEKLYPAKKRGHPERSEGSAVLFESRDTPTKEQR
jgi:hypothetical protein